MCPELRIHSKLVLFQYSGGRRAGHSRPQNVQLLTTFRALSRQTVRPLPETGGTHDRQRHGALYMSRRDVEIKQRPGEPIGSVAARGAVIPRGA